MRMKTGTKTIAASVLAVAILTTLLIGTFSSLNSIEVESALVRHTHTVQMELMDLRTFILQAHAGQRAYILSKDAGYLDRYHKAISDFTNEISNLAQLTADNPAQQDRLKNLETLVIEKFQMLDKSVQVRQNSTAPASVLTPSMVPVFDNPIDEKMSTIIRELNQEESRLLEERVLRNQTAIAESIRLRIFSSIGSGLILLLLATVFISELRQRKCEEERFKVVVEALPSAVVLVNKEGIIEMVNANTEKIFAYPRNEILGHHVEILLPERFRDEHPANRASFFSDPTTRAMGAGRELFGRKKDGTEFPLEIGLSPLETLEGTKVLAAAVDITERKRLSDKLYESLNLQASIVESSGDAIISKTLEGVVTSWNGSAEKIFGYTAEEAIGQKVADLIFSQDQRDEEQLLLERVRRGEVIRNYDTIRRCKSGLFIHVSVSLSPIYNAAGTVIGISSIKRDISPQKRAEAAALRFTEELKASNRDLEQFAFVASHDLQEPLRAITGFAQLLEKRYKQTLDERADTYIEHIVSGAQRMQRMIEDLLEFARLARGSSSFQPFEIQTAVDDALRLLTERIKQTKAVIETKKLPFLLGNQAQFRQLFQNLIGNALKFCPPDRVPHITISATNEKLGATITIRDNGIGIKPEYAERVFGLFQRLHTRDQYEGTGIGLAVCKRIIEIHEGRIWLNPITEGEGAEFAFFIPATMSDTNRRSLDEQDS